MKKNIYLASIVIVFLTITIVVIKIIKSSSSIILKMKIERKNVNDLFENTKNYIPEAKYLMDITPENEISDSVEINRIYRIVSNQHTELGYLAIANSKTYCDVCKDVRLFILLGNNAEIISVTPMESFEINGEIIDTINFFNQFVGKSELSKNDFNGSIKNITGATKSAEASIQLVSCQVNYIG